MTYTGGPALGAEAAKRLAALGSATIKPGLSEAEFARVEDMLGLEFADDHRAFLSSGLPVGTSWPNWRDEGRKSLAKRLILPGEGVLFAVEWSQFWHDGWGPRPAKAKDALRSAKYQLARVPQLIPVHSHRYLPAGRGSYGHPVLSVIQLDVTVSGADLADFIDRELGSDRAGDRHAVPTVEFWSTLVP